MAARAGWTANAARKTALLICALCVVPVAAAPVVADKWTAVLLIGLAAAAHQGFSANLFTLASDMFPRRAVGSVIGIGGTAGRRRRHPDAARPPGGSRTRPAAT